jgi:hypothetical protein
MWTNNKRVIHVSVPAGGLQDGLIQYSFFEIFHEEFGNYW